MNNNTESNICPICNKTCKDNAKYFPYHSRCWRKTEEGRKYMREMKQKSRQKNNPGKYPLIPKIYSNDPAAVRMREKRNCTPNKRYHLIK